MAEPPPQEPQQPSTPAPPAAQPTSSQPPQRPQAERDTQYGHIPIGEEMDRARWTLPPVGIIAIGLLIVLVVGAALGWFNRYQPAASGRLNDIFAVELADHASVLATVQVTVRNDTDKTISINNLKGQLKANGQTYDDVPASAIDYERYFQAFPDLRQHAGEALRPETKIEPGHEVKGTLVFGFQVTKQQFDQRQSLDITVEPYDLRAIIIAEKPAK